MPPELKKATPVRLRSAGLDEKWLQHQVLADPSILGLGDVRIIQRERTQPSGGRIDFLMADSDTDTRYEVEIMLGAVDESHIIRTIEYWDVERQRYPAFDHQAVIVAEEITSRFFNVIRLLNRAVPIIAIQLNALTVDGALVLHFTKVLDILESGNLEDDEPHSEQADREMWVKQTNPASLGVADKVIALLHQPSGGYPKVTYNQGHIAVGSVGGHNFCWLYPRRSASHCNFNLRLPDAADRVEIIQRFDEADVTATAHRKNNEIKFRMTSNELDGVSVMLAEILRQCEEASRI